MADDATARYLQSLAAGGAQVDLTALAGQHRDQGSPGLAEAVLAIAVQRAPTSGEARANHALALHELGRHAEALVQAEHSVALAPGLAAAWFNLGLIRAALRDEAGAAQAHAQAQALAPQSGMHHLQAGLDLQRQGRLLEAQGAFRYAMTLDGPSPEAWINLGTVLLESGDSQAAEDAALAALALRPQDRRAAANLLMAQQYNPRHTAQALRDSARHWGALWEVSQAPQPPLLAPRNGARPLRVGYLSGDFRQHPIGWLIAPVLAAHDPAAVDVHVFDTDTGRQHGDPLKAELRTVAPHWHEVGGLDDAELAARVRAADIDVLVELAGHTDGGRLGVLAQRAAPVQLSWLGYFASTGVAQVDGVITGDAVGDGHAAAWYTEPLLHLGRPHIAWRPPAGPLPESTPASARTGQLTFGSFNTAAKLSDATVALWARLLHARADSRLLLRRACFGDPAFAEHTRRRFASFGIAHERIAFAPALPHDQMLASYGEIDVALDPLPFSGLITSLEALWMGVPVTTLTGLRPVSRQTEMLLHALGRDDWIASTPQAWLDRTLQLADDEAARAAWLQSCRAEMRASPLLDGADLARRLESLYLRLR